MKGPDTIGSFFQENKQLAREWLETRLEVYKLKLIRLFSKSAGYLMWTLISLFLVTLFIIFAGLTMGFWLSSMMGSYARGFGTVTLGIVVLIATLAALRRVLFVNPIIRKIIGDSMDETQNDETQSNN